MPWEERPAWPVASLLVVAAMAALSIDIPVAQWCLLEKCPDLIRELVAVAETFGNGLGVAIILLAVWLLDEKGRRRLPRMISGVVLAGLGANMLKLLLSRARPRSYEFTHNEVLKTFGNWFPIDTIQSTAQSFPSAHTATAVALAVALTWSYPRGRWLFAMLAVLVGMQRVETGAHFLSDTIVGAAIGWVAVTHALHPKALLGATARLETWLAARESPHVATREPRRCEAA